MPAPTKGQLGSAVDGFFQGVGLEGENASDLADVVAEAIATALDMFVQTAMVEPGIAGAVDPITTSGATTAPGRLSTTLQAAQLEPIVSGLLSGAGIQGDAAEGLGKAIAGLIAYGIDQFTQKVQVAPGIAVAGAVTAAPGVLM
ncbi:hypothetical protein [Haliangium sp.]|uniref:hypothetical protein n=1 Tax=Haliangium sp. TaxID=2663208 RepID=UPI003D119953